MTSVSDADLTALADTVLKLASKVDLRAPALRDVIPLTGTEIAVIREIHLLQRPSPSQIAEATGLQRSNVSTALRSLEARGLVVREHRGGNARSVELVPTPLAAEFLDQIHDYWVRRLRTVDADVLAEAVGALTALDRLAAELDH